MKFVTQNSRRKFYIFIALVFSIFSLCEMFHVRNACFPSTNWLAASGHRINRERVDARIL